MLPRAKRCSRLRRRYQLLIPITTTAPVIHPHSTEWKNLLTATGLLTTAQKSTISFLTVSGLKTIPTGCCIQPLAMSIQSAERDAPNAVSQVDARWNPLLTLPQPNNITAMKVASMKKAKMPSMASGAPNMSPTNQE